MRKMRGGGSYFTEWGGEGKAEVREYGKGDCFVQGKEGGGKGTVLVKGRERE